MNERKKQTPKARGGHSISSSSSSDADIDAIGAHYRKVDTSPSVNDLSENRNDPHHTSKSYVRENLFVNAS